MSHRERPVPDYARCPPATLQPWIRSLTAARRGTTPLRLGVAYQTPARGKP